MPLAACTTIFHAHRRNFGARVKSPCCRCSAECAAECVQRAGRTYGAQRMVPSAPNLGAPGLGPQHRGSIGCNGWRPQGPPGAPSNNSDIPQREKNRSGSVVVWGGAFVRGDSTACMYALCSRGPRAVGPPFGMP